MTGGWTPKETTTSQDHVIAHVVGSTVLGYLVLNEALYILLDIGFVWTIFVDGEMALLPHPVAVKELEIDDEAREQIKTDIDLLLGDNPSVQRLSRVSLPPVVCQIKDVSFFACGDQRRLLVMGEKANLAIETSMVTAAIQVYEF